MRLGREERPPYLAPTRHVSRYDRERELDRWQRRRGRARAATAAPRAASPCFFESGTGMSFLLFLGLGTPRRQRDGRAGPYDDGDASHDAGGGRMGSHDGGGRTPCRRGRPRVTVRPPITKGTAARDRTTGGRATRHWGRPRGTVRQGGRAPRRRGRLRRTAQRGNAPHGEGNGRAGPCDGGRGGTPCRNGATALDRC